MSTSYGTRPAPGSKFTVPASSPWPSIHSWNPRTIVDFPDPAVPMKYRFRAIARPARPAPRIKAATYGFWGGDCSGGMPPCGGCFGGGHDRGGGPYGGAGGIGGLWRGGT